MTPLLRLVIFLSLISTVSVLAHVYLYRRLFRDTWKHPAWHKAGVAVMSALCVVLLGSRFFSRLLPADTGLVLSQFGWFWFGVVIYLLLAVLSLGSMRSFTALVVRVKARLLGAQAVAAQPAVAEAAAAEPAPVSVSEERRLFLARATAGVALAATGGVASYGMWRAFHPPSVTEVAVRLRGLPKALEGFTVLQLSDVHVGPLIQRRFMEAVVAQCNGLRPDLVTITGDLVDGSVSELGHAVSALQGLRSRHGTYFVTGNHEYYSGDGPWTEALQGMGVEVLRNRRVSIGEPGASFDLVGVDDWAAHRSGYEQGYDLKAALAGREPDRAVVLLAHQPAGWREAAQAGVGLQLSGHTHGGQFFPFNLAISAIWEHDAGHFEENGNHIYVSRGTGFWGPPLRVAAPPEIVKVVLLPA